MRSQAGSLAQALLLALAASLAITPVAWAAPEDSAPPSGTTTGESAQSGETVEESLPGDPLTDGLPVASDSASHRETTKGDIDSVLSDASTSAVTIADGTLIFSRSSSPGTAVLVGADGSVTRTLELPVGQGAWAALTLSDSKVLVGVNSPGAIVEIDTTTWTARIIAQLGTSEIPMAMVRDETIPRTNTDLPAAWIGVYNPNGARLLRYDPSFSRIVDYPVLRSTSGTLPRYIRSLYSTADGLTFSFGTPTQVRYMSAADGAAVAWNPQSWPIRQAANELAFASSFVYSMTGNSASSGSSASAPTPTDDLSSLVFLGTQNPATIATMRHGSILSQISIESDEAIDQLSFDSALSTLWATSRPSGSLWRIHVTGDGSLSDPERVGAPVPSSETRFLLANSERVTGTTGTSDVWTYEVASGVTSVVTAEDSGVPTPADVVPQGLAVFGGCTFVGGHWRFQVHGDCSADRLDIAGEPKVQVAVGDELYVGTYPNAELIRVNSDLEVNVLATVGNKHQRPRALTYDPSADILWMSTRPAYGHVGGALSAYSRSTRTMTSVFQPFGSETATAIAVSESAVFVGTETVGEAVEAPAGSTPSLRRLSKGKGSSLTENWVSRPVRSAASYTGLRIVKDRLGSYLVALTNTGVLVAVDATTGRPLWSQDVGAFGQSLTETTAGTIALVDGVPFLIGITRSGVTLNRASEDSIRFLAEDPDSPLTMRIVTGANRPLLVDEDAADWRTLRRVFGADRYATAALAANDEGDADAVVLALGTAFPDALTGSVLAAHLDAPLLLTASTSLPAATTASLKADLPTSVYIIGGTGAITAGVEASLKAMGVSNIVRLGGEDRYGTARAVAAKMKEDLGPNAPAVLATGADFPDALSSVQLANDKDAVLLLIRPGAQDEDTRTALTGARELYTVGGQAQVGAASMGLVPTRTFTGKDRYATSALVAASLKGRTGAVVVTGMDFPDAISGSVLAVSHNSVLVLSSTDSLSTNTSRLLAARETYTRIHLLGGPTVISRKVEDSLR